MRWIWICLGMGLFLLSATAFAGVDQAAARDRFQADNPAAGLYYSGMQITRVYGPAFSSGGSAEESARSFLHNHAGMLGVESAELVPGNHFNEWFIIPVMYEPERGDYKFALVYYAQYRDGIPVFRADARLLVRNEPGYPLVLVASALRDLGDFRSDKAQAAAPFDRLEKIAPEMTNYSEPQTVIWAGVNDQVVAPRLAISFTADNHDLSDLQKPEKWLYVADAVSGEILYQEDLIVFTDVTGSVSGMATEGAKADICNAEVPMAMPWAYVAIQGGSGVYADGGGNFTIPNAGSNSVTVQSFMYGTYFTIDNYAGAEETLSMSVFPPGPANFMHNEANTSDLVRAQTNAYVTANQVRDWVLAQNPSFPTISTETGFPIYVNRTDGYCPCNAWSDGSSINFCQAGGGCPNTAWQSVLNHEYGHHVIDCGGSGQGQYGEGMADCHSMLPVDDPILGYGFEGNCNAGIRTADNDYQYPCSGEIHDCGQLLSGCVWSTRNELIVTEPADYLEILSNLTVNSILLHSGDLITPQITIDFLTLDDDNGDLSDGTPHFDEITTGFGAHNMWAGPPPDNDECVDAEVACPGTYQYSSDGMTNDGSASCGSSNSSPDVWYVYTPATSGTLELDLCDSDYDTVLSVHTGCPGTASNEIDCHDDSGWFGPCGFLPSSGSYLSLSVTAYNTYYIRISGNSQTGTYMLQLSGPDCAPFDDTPPTPDPMTFASAPAAVSSSAISMTATTATDADSPPVEYEFDFVSGGSGGSDSGWQAATTYADDGLDPNTTYTYRVRAQDSAPSANATGYSTEASATTFANVPGAPTLGGPTSTTLDLSVNANGNPGYTEFAARCLGTDPADPAWDGAYVDASGGASGSAVWQTESQWGTTTVVGLQPTTEYTFAVKARNTDGVETAFGPGATLATAGPDYEPGDLNCDGVINTFDIDPFVLALTDPVEYANQYPACDRMLADIDDSGEVNTFDIDPFVDLLTGK